MISVIVTVLNEAETMATLLESLGMQTRVPDEIIIVDGGSDDGTLDILCRFQDRLPLRIIRAPGTNISQGRNLAIAAAHGDIIVATDAGLYLSPQWLECLVAPFLNDPELHVVGGYAAPDPHSLFEMALGAAVSRLPDEIKPEQLLPGSRNIAYRKRAWQAVGGYPEWLDFGEDMVFALKLKQLVGRIAYAPSAIIYFRPRSSLKAFFKMYYHYARGDGKADLWRKRHAIRYFTYLIAVPGIFLLGAIVHPLLWTLFPIGGLVYLYHPYRRLWVALRKTQASLLSMTAAVLMLPIIRLTGDIAKMIGYPVGLLWRFQRKPPDWRIKEKIV